MDDRKIQQIVTDQGLKGFRAKQLRNAFFEQHVTDFSEISTLPKALRATLSETYSAMTMKPQVVLRSKDGCCVKALMVLPDGTRIETVLLSPKPGLWTTCISSQVGCALMCTFCATGKMGLTRHLTSEEITDQVLFWRQYMARELPDERLDNVVYMGMGEPLHNREGVFASLGELMNPETFCMGARHLSVSTSGLAPHMKELTDLYPQVNLAVSLHAANDALRLSLMPVNKRWNLDDVADAIQYHLDQTNRKIFIEYILIAGQNDQLEHADELVSYLQRFNAPHLIHVNLIPCNPTDAKMAGSTRDASQLFRDRLVARHVMATIRKTLGRDLDGACGQLALKVPTTAKQMPIEAIPGL